MMVVRRVLLIVLVCVAGFGGHFGLANAAAFTCPDNTASACRERLLPLPNLYSGADDMTASNRLGELMADLRQAA